MTMELAYIIRSRHSVAAASTSRMIALDAIYRAHSFIIYLSFLSERDFIYIYYDVYMCGLLHHCPCAVYPFGFGYII